jgi:hypothetical protein
MSGCFDISSRHRQSLCLTRHITPDDDGATWYIDDAFNVPPYIHNGKPAVLAYLYKCDDGKVFVQYLLKFPDAVKTTIQIEAKQGVDPEIAIDMARSNQALLKRPGDKEWLKTAGGMSSRMGEFIRIISARCPDGKPAIAVGIDEQAKP